MDLDTLLKKLEEIKKVSKGFEISSRYDLVDIGHLDNVVKNMGLCFPNEETLERESRTKGKYIISRDEYQEMISNIFDELVKAFVIFIKNKDQQEVKTYEELCKSIQNIFFRNDELVVVDFQNIFINYKPFLRLSDTSSKCSLIESEIQESSSLVKEKIKEIKTEMNRKKIKMDFNIVNLLAIYQSGLLNSKKSAVITVLPNYYDISLPPISIISLDNQRHIFACIVTINKTEELFEGKYYPIDVMKSFDDHLCMMLNHFFNHIKTTIENNYQQIKVPQINILTGDKYRDISNITYLHESYTTHKISQKRCYYENELVGNIYKLRDCKRSKFGNPRSNYRGGSYKNSTHKNKKNNKKNNKKSTKRKNKKTFKMKRKIFKKNK